MRLKGPMIQALRLARGWTPQRLASESRTSRATVNRAERGESVYPTTAARLARALSTPDYPVTPGMLWADNPNAQTSPAAVEAPRPPAAGDPDEDVA